MNWGYVDVKTLELEATLGDDRTLTLKDLPFSAGAALEVTVREKGKTIANGDERVRYPLWGTVYRYDDPFEPAVPIEDWGDLA
jgi:hypothetical protein